MKKKKRMNVETFTTLYGNDILPMDCKLAIFEFCQPKSLLYKLPYVCKAWRSTLLEYEQSLWKRICFKRWPILEISNCEWNWKQMYLSRSQLDSPYLHLELADAIEEQLKKIRSCGTDCKSSTISEHFAKIQELSNRIMDKKKLHKRYERGQKSRLQEYRSIVDPDLEEMEELDCQEETIEQRKEKLFLEWLVSHKKESVELFDDNKKHERSWKIWSPSGQSIMLQYSILESIESRNNAEHAVQISYQKDANSKSVSFYYYESEEWQTFISGLKDIFQQLNLQHLTLNQLWDTLIAPAYEILGVTDHEASRFIEAFQKQNSDNRVQPYDIRYVDQSSEKYYLEGKKYLLTAPEMFSVAPERYLGDKELVLQLMPKSKDVVKHIDSLLEDLDVIHLAYQLDPSLLLEHFPTRAYKYDEYYMEEVKNIVLQRPELFDRAPSVLKDDRNFVMQVVRINGKCLTDASDRLQNDEELLLTALQNSFVETESLKKLIPKETVQNAVLSCATLSQIRNLLHIHPELKRNKAFMLKALNKHGTRLVQMLPSLLIQDREIMLQALSVVKMGSDFRSLKTQFRTHFANDKEFVSIWLATNTNYQILHEVYPLLSDEVKRDKSILLEFLKQRHAVVFVTTTGYGVFSLEKRQEIKAANPTIRTSELLKTVLRSWKELSDEEKKKYQARSDRNENVTTISVTPTVQRKLRALVINVCPELQDDPEIQKYLP